MPEEQDAVRMTAHHSRAINHICRAWYNGFQLGIVPVRVVFGAGILHQQVFSGCHRNACMDSRTLPLVYIVPYVFSIVDRMGQRPNRELMAG